VLIPYRGKVAIMWWLCPPVCLSVCRLLTSQCMRVATRRQLPLHPWCHGRLYIIHINRSLATDMCGQRTVFFGPWSATIILIRWDTHNWFSPKCYRCRSNSLLLTARSYRVSLSGWYACLNCVVACQTCSLPGSLPLSFCYRDLE